MIDGAIYNLICYVYEIFYYLATLNIFTEEHYQKIVSRIYVILGLFMLFVLAYSLLKAIINPDEFAKGEQSFPNLIKNVIISLVIIILLPTVFSVAFNIQNSILEYDTIPKLILGVDGASEDNSGGGRMIAYNLHHAFLYPNSEVCSSTNIEDCRANIKGNGWIGFRNGDPLSEVDTDVQNGASFINYNAYSEAVRDGDLTYLFPISTVAGIFTLWVLLNFCFDMAIRVVKLAFYQIIAPIPVICRILPGGSMKDVFSKWVKQVVSIFLEVFIRIAILSICVFLIEIVIDAYEAGLPGIGSLGVTQQPIVLALIIMGIVIFMKQAPQILGDLLNLKTDGMKLGLMDKLAMGGGLLAGAAVGGGLTSGVRNFAGAFTGKGIVQDFKNKNFKGAFKKIGSSVVPGLKSGVAGAGSGLVRGGFAGRGAKNFKDMAGAAGKGAAGAAAARAKRAAYKANHRVNIGKDKLGALGQIPVVGGLAAGAVSGLASFGNTMLGHGGDALHSAGQFIGIDNMEALMNDNKIIDDINARKKGVRSAAEDLIVGESNKAGVDKSFGIAGMSTKHLRELRQNVEAAKGTSGYAAAQDAYDSYLKSFVDGVQNQALLGTRSWESLGVGDRADLGEVRIAAKNYRDILKANLAQRYVANSGFTASILDDGNSLDVGSGPMKDIGDQLKIAKTENSMKINELRQKKENSGK